MHDFTAKPGSSMSMALVGYENPCYANAFKHLSNMGHLVWWETPHVDTEFIKILKADVTVIVIPDEATKKYIQFAQYMRRPLVFFNGIKFFTHSQIESTDKFSVERKLVEDYINKH